jgi:hypothetical protein
MTSYYHIRGPVKGVEYPEDSPLEGPVVDEFVVTATSEEAALRKHQTHCEELGIELEDITIEVLDEYLDEGDQLFGVEDTIWQPGDSIGEAQRNQTVGALTPIHTGILSTIHWMNKNDDKPVSADRVVEQYESNHDHQLDQSKVPKLFNELIEDDFVEREREDGVGVYSVTPERVRELRRHSLKQARLYEWADRNLAEENDG